jgi:hypothetical protein
VYYSPIRYRLVMAIGVVLAAAELAYGVAGGGTTAVAVGVAGLVLVGLFARGVSDKLRQGVPALAREGAYLVGGELARPLPIADTTFEIVSDHAGSWVVVLRCADATIRLGAGGWRVEGERAVTRSVAERVLLALGLTPRT